MGDLFSLEDVSALKNAGRYPMVLAMTCFSAPFDNPTDDSIGERFLREADKGAVAVFAASWKNWPNTIYSRNLVEELLKPGNRIGDAIVAAKAKMPMRDFVEIYNLLGDPAIVLAQPPGRIEFMLAPERWNPHLVVRVPGPDFGGEVAIDWIDAQGAVLDTVRYELRDTLFSLPLRDKATGVRVYATDTRNGFAAFGAASLLPPPPPKPAPVRQAAAAPPPGPMPARSPPPPPPTAAKPHAAPARNLPDNLSRRDFETSGAPGPDARAAPVRH